MGISLRRSRKRRHVQGHHVEAEVKVFAERSVLVSRFKIAVGGGDHAHVDLNPLVAAHRTHFFFLQYAQQFGLQFQRQFADFVEKDRAAIGGLEQSLLRFQGSGECSLFIAEEFAFDQRGHERSAIDGDKGTVGESSAEMHGAGYQFFAGPAFAVDEDRRARVFQPRNHAQHFLNLGGRADDAVDRGFRIRTLTKKFVFLDQADLFRHAAQETAAVLPAEKTAW